MVSKLKRVYRVYSNETDNFDKASTYSEFHHKIPAFNLAKEIIANIRKAIKCGQPVHVRSVTIVTLDIVEIVKSEKNRKV